MDVKDLSYPLFKTTKWEKKILSRAYEKIDNGTEAYVCHAIDVSLSWWDGFFHIQRWIALKDKMPALLEISLHESGCDNPYKVGTNKSRRLEWIRQLLEYEGE